MTRKPRGSVLPLAEAGATWWIESPWEAPSVAEPAPADRRGTTAVRFDVSGVVRPVTPLLLTLTPMWEPQFVNVAQRGHPVLAELFRHNLWANLTLIDLCATLPDEILETNVPGIRHCSRYSRAPRGHGGRLPPV